MRNYRIYILVMLFVMMFSGARHANAQSFDVSGGLGTATDKSNGQSIDTYGDGVLHPTPKLTGVFGTVGGSFMLRPSFGVGAELSSRFSRSDYAGLSYRPRFYDFNAIWLPHVGTDRVVPELQAGVGGANLKFYYSQQFCDTFAGCSTSNSYLESSNHFQAHLGAGLRIYVKGGLYVKPQFDVHYVKNFFQFGNNWVPQYSVLVGYTFGKH